MSQISPNDICNVTACLSFPASSSDASSEVRASAKHVRLVTSLKLEAWSAKDHGREKEARLFPFPLSFARSCLSKKERCLGTRQCLSTNIAFYYIFAEACVEIIFRLFNFFFSTSILFLFSLLSAAVIDLLLCLLPVQIILKKHHPDGLE